MGFLTNVMTTATNKLGRTGLKMQKYAPEAALVIGGALIIGGAVKACFDTHAHCDDILKEYKEGISRAEDTYKLVENNKKAECPVEMQEYTLKDLKSDKRKFGMKAAVQFAKTYALDAIMVVGGTVLMGCAFKTMKVRFKGAAAMAGAATAELYSIKKNVIDQLGEEEGRNLMYGGQVINVETKETDEDGEEVTVSKPLNVTPKERYDAVSEYAVYFDEKCSAWQNSPDYNLSYLRTAQDHFTDLLQHRGHVFLNEVYDRLGLPRTSMGAVVGWVKGLGDDYVDFGIYNTNIQINREFSQGYSNICLLDFNVDGVIFDKI